MKNKMDFKNRQVLILGGGISGCSAAWILKRLGADVSIIEMEDECGGIGRTHHLGDTKYDFGPHILHAKQDYTINFYKKSGARTGEIYAKRAADDTFDNLIDFPYSVDTIFQLPIESGREIVKELFESIKTIPQDKSPWEGHSSFLIKNVFMKKLLFDIGGL